jgi:hypothetical protein
MTRYFFSVSMYIGIYVVLAVLVLVVLAIYTPTLSASDMPFCSKGYSASVRPPVAYTQAIKLELLHGRNPKSYELDHVVPLCMGGNPTDQANMQLQLWADAERKDKLEAALCRKVCNGTMPLDQAQEIMKGWH